MARTLLEVDTALARVELAYAVLNTTEDLIALTTLNDTRHQTILDGLAALTTRIEDLETAIIAAMVSLADHETRIAALE